MFAIEFYLSTASHIGPFPRELGDDIEKKHLYFWVFGLGVCEVVDALNEEVR